MVGPSTVCTNMVLLQMDDSGSGTGHVRKINYIRWLKHCTIWYQPVGRERGQQIELNHMASDLINCAYIMNPVKTKWGSSGELPWLAILWVSLCIDVLGDWYFLRTGASCWEPSKTSLYVSLFFGWFWFISVCYSKTKLQIQHFSEFNDPF